MLLLEKVKRSHRATAASLRTGQDVFVDGSFGIRQVEKCSKINKMYEGICPPLFSLCVRGGCTAEGSDACKGHHFGRKYCEFHSLFFPPGQNASNEMLVGQSSCV